MTLNPFQFTMFEPAGKLADSAHFNHVDKAQRTTEELSGHKVRESKDPWGPEKGFWGSDRAEADAHGEGYEYLTLHQSIERFGIRNPPKLASPGQAGDWQDRADQQNPSLPMLGDGHHRVFTQAEINPAREVPVEWVEKDLPDVWDEP